MRLVKDWKRFWKWHSTQAMTIAAILPLAWEQIPRDLRSAIPDQYVPWIAGIILIAGIVGRLRQQ